MCILHQTGRFYTDWETTVRRVRRKTRRNDAIIQAAKKNRGEPEEERAVQRARRVREVRQVRKKDRPGREENL